MDHVTLLAITTAMCHSPHEGTTLTWDPGDPAHTAAMGNGSILQQRALSLSLWYTSTLVRSIRYDRCDRLTWAPRQRPPARLSDTSQCSYLAAFRRYPTSSWTGTMLRSFDITPCGLSTRVVLGGIGRDLRFRKTRILRHCPSSVSPGLTLEFLSQPPTVWLEGLCYLVAHLATHVFSLLRAWFHRRELPLEYCDHEQTHTGQHEGHGRDE